MSEASFTLFQNTVVGIEVILYACCLTAFFCPYMADAVYPRIPASCHKPFRGHPIPIRGYGDQLDVQEIGKLLKVCIPKKGQSF